MPQQKSATPRTTRNSRGLRDTTPATGRTSRESSVTSDDGSQRTSNSLRRSRRSRESSVASDDGNHPLPTPRTRSRRSRSRSVEPATNAPACTTGNHTKSSTAHPQTQLPLPPVSAFAPTTPQPTRTSARTLHGAQAAPALTPITEESPAPARFGTPSIEELESTVAAAHIASPAIEPVSPRTSAEDRREPSPVHTAKVDVAQPSQTVTVVAEQSTPKSIRSLTALVASPTAVVANSTAPTSLHRVGLSFSLQPVTPLRYDFVITDDELQDLIHKECDESEVEDPDHAWIKVRRARTIARRKHKLEWRRNQLRRTFALPEEFSEVTHPLIIGEDPDYYTENYGSFKNEEGHAFGARLLQSIKDDHERRGCICPPPRVYHSRAAAEAGQGTFRFFRHFKQPGFNNVWVFMRKDDWHWHCTCDKKPLSDFAIWVRKHRAEKFAEELARRESEEQLVREYQEESAKRTSRKRKAQDDETELVDSETTRVVDGPRLPSPAAVRRRRIAPLKSARLLRSVQSAGSDLAAESVKFMGGVLSTAAITMGTSVKHFLTRVGAQLSTVWNTRQAQTTIERRTQEENGNIVVKRLKRQHFVPITTTEEQEAWEAAKARVDPSPFDVYAWFEWTDDPTRYIGEDYLKLFKKLGNSVHRDIVGGRYHWDVSEDAIREHHKHTRQQIAAGLTSRDQDYNLELSLRFFRHGMEKNKVDEVVNPTAEEDDEDDDLAPDDKGKYRLPDEHRRRIRELWEEGSASVSQIIDRVYLSKDIMSNLKKKFGPKPPKDLSAFITEDLRTKAQAARNYMVRFLQEERTLDDRMKLAVTRFVADMDTLHKLDIPYSLVEFPGKLDDNKTLPGSWPLELLEDVPLDGLYIQPIHELQAPEPEPNHDNGTADNSMASEARATPAADAASGDAVAVDAIAPHLARMPRSHAAHLRAATLAAASDDDSEDEAPSSPLLLVPSRSILKVPSKKIPAKHRMPGDKPGTRITFSRDLRSFASPQFKPQRLTRPKPVDKAGKDQKRVDDAGAVKKAKKLRSAVPKETRKLWKLYLQDIFTGRSKPMQSQQAIPLGNPADQTMEEAGVVWRKHLITGEMEREVAPTKYDRFLKETRDEIFEGGWPIAPMTKNPPSPYDGSMAKTPPRTRQARDGGMADGVSAPISPRKDGQESPYRPIRAIQFGSPPAPKPVKTIEQVKMERELLLNDHSNDLFPDAELQIATKKLDDLNIARQVREEEQAAAERARIELARKVQEEKRRREAEERRKAEEERRRREEEERRAAEEQRRAREAAAARRREEERQRDTARRRDARIAALGLRVPTRAIITPLSDTWESRVTGIHGSVEGRELARTPDGTPLSRRDFVERLLPATAWLNDNIIIGAIQHIGDLVNQKAGATKDNPKCATFTSYFYPRLESAGPANCGRLMRRAGVRKDNFKDIESILIPICSGNHWTLAVVLPQKRAVLHMDSLRGGRGNPAVTNKILEWVKVTLGDDFVASEWSVVNIDGPTQTNGWDCGVFTITNALCMALGLDPKESYAPRQLTAARTMLAAILLNGGFTGDFDLDGV